MSRPARNDSVAFATLEAEDLTKRYGRRVWALRGINLRIEPGGLVALVGPNAAGKSTLIRSWVGFERPTSGRARVAGFDAWTQRGDALRHVGYVPQNPTLYEALSVEAHVAMAAKLRPGLDRLLALRRLGELNIPLAALGRHLSGGQQAQVVLTLAVATRAPVLLMDEPLASLDPLARREFMHLVRQAVNETGATGLLSSHVIGDVAEICDRLIVLGVGRVLLDSTVADALGRHSISTSPVPGSVADFPAADRTTLSLLRDRAGVGANIRPATLEEIVLGHLAAGRRDPDARAINRD